MKGYIISIDKKDDYSRTLFNHTLYGRTNYRRYKKKVTAYYYPGILDTRKFYKISSNKIFVENITDEECDILELFGVVKKEPYEINDSFPLITGREFWRNKALEKGIVFKAKLKKCQKR